MSRSGKFVLHSGEIVVLTNSLNTRRVIDVPGILSRELIGDLVALHSNLLDGKHGLVKFGVYKCTK